jgi:hypothetical protein
MNENRAATRVVFRKAAIDAFAVAACDAQNDNLHRAVRRSDVSSPGSSLAFCIPSRNIRSNSDVSMFKVMRGAFVYEKPAAISSALPAANRLPAAVVRVSVIHSTGDQQTLRQELVAICRE